MVECSLDLIFFLNWRQTICFSGWGAGADFFQQLKLDLFIDKVKIFFVTQLSTIAVSPYTLV